MSESFQFVPFNEIGICSKIESTVPDSGENTVWIILIVIVLIVLAFMIYNSFKKETQNNPPIL